MLISDLLQQRQRSLFVGRTEQLDLLAKTVSSPEWQLLHIYGPGGIGKTTLLKMYAHTLDSSRCMYLDGYSGFRSPEDFLAKICQELPSPTRETSAPGTVIDRLNQYALALRQEVVLIIDTFEQFEAIENWLRHHFLSRLHERVKVITAGRYALTGEWLRGEWNLLVRNVELKSLSPSEIVQYVQIRGIENKEMTETLARFSKGVPLALSLACEILVRNGEAAFLSVVQQYRVIGHLARELTRDINDAELKQYIEAASLMWKFDQDLLEAVTGQHIPSDKFREFCGLPFVTQHEHGWSLHDSVRQWISIDFRQRMPERFQQYRHLTLDVLRKREAEHPDKREEYIMEKLFLSENDFVRNLCFQLDDNLIFRTCTEDSLDQVERLYLKYLRSQPNYVPGEAHLESLIRPLWRIDPAAFASLWKEERLVAFCACLRLTEQTIPIFRSHPLTAPAVQIYDPNGQQYLACLAGVDPELEQEISGSVARALVRIVDIKGALIINLLAFPNWLPYLPILGYERAPWADAVTPGGMVYQAYQLDLRNVEFHSLVDRIVSASEASDGISRMLLPGPAEPRLPLEEAVTLVKRTLKHYASLPLQPETAATLRPLLGADASSASAESVARLVQERIQSIVQALAEGNEEEKRYSRILYCAYIKKIGSHDQVAEYLNMSVPNYYRHLRRAVRRLSYELMKPGNTAL